MKELMRTTETIADKIGTMKKDRITKEDKDKAEIGDMKEGGNKVEIEEKNQGGNKAEIEDNKVKTEDNRAEIGDNKVKIEGTRIKFQTGMREMIEKDEMIIEGIKGQDSIRDSTEKTDRTNNKISQDIEGNFRREQEIEEEAEVIIEKVESLDTEIEIEEMMIMTENSMS